MLILPFLPSNKNLKLLQQFVDIREAFPVIIRCINDHHGSSVLYTFPRILYVKCKYWLVGPRLSFGYST